MSLVGLFNLFGAKKDQMAHAAFLGGGGVLLGGGVLN